MESVPAPEVEEDPVLTSTPSKVESDDEAFPTPEVSAAAAQARNRAFVVERGSGDAGASGSRSRVSRTGPAQADALGREAMTHPGAAEEAAVVGNGVEMEMEEEDVARAVGIADAEEGDGGLSPARASAKLDHSSAARYRAAIADAVGEDAVATRLAAAIDTSEEAVGGMKEATEEDGADAEALAGESDGVDVGGGLRRRVVAPQVSPMTTSPTAAVAFLPSTSATQRTPGILPRRSETAAAGLQPVSSASPSSRASAVPVAPWTTIPTTSAAAPTVALSAPPSSNAGGQQMAAPSSSSAATAPSQAGTATAVSPLPPIHPPRTGSGRWAPVGASSGRSSRTTATTTTSAPTEPPLLLVQQKRFRFALGLQLCARLREMGALEETDASRLKDLILEGHPALAATLEALEFDADAAEALDTVLRVLRRARVPQ